jgi:PrtD family type I secretion system ABC transporter
MAELQQTQDSSPSDTGRTPLRQVLADCKSAFMLMAFISFVVNILGVVPTLYMMNMYDRVLSSKSGVTMVSLVVLVVGIYLFWSALEWIRNRIMIRISLRLDWDLAASAFDASFRRNADRRAVNVQQVMGDLLVLRQFLTGRSVISVVDAPFSLFYIAVGGMIHPLLALFALFATVLVTGLAFLNRKIATPALRAANEATSEANRVAAQSLRFSETAMSMGMLPALRRRWHDKHRWFLQHQVNGSEASGLVGWISGVVTKLTPSLQMAVGVFLAIQGVITGGMVIAATFLIHRSVGPLKSLINNWRDVVSARMAFERLDQLMVEDRQREQRMSLPAPKGQLDVTQLEGTPPGGKLPVIKSVQFSLPAGQSLVIVGPNGAGKSSLLKLLLGLWRPSKGFVRLDGADVADWDHDELGPHVGYVPQDAELFEATVAENIARLGEVDSEKVVQAARRAGIHEMILSLPKGYDTFLGDSGFTVSGGQAQRISLARALYGDPKLLFLDEPNSKLDQKAEDQLINTIRQLQQQGVTVVFSTHKPRMIALAQHLLVLQDGLQIGFGPAKEMINRLHELNREKASHLAAVKPVPPAAVAKPVAAKPDSAKSPVNKSVSSTTAAQVKPLPTGPRKGNGGQTS